VGGALLVAAGALALPGRGGGEREDRFTKGEYERAVRVAYADVQAAFAATRVGPAELPGRLADAEASLRRAATDLGTIQPPAGVAREHRDLVAGLSAYAAELARLRRARDANAVAAFNRAISTSESIELIAEAAERMKFKGYDLGRLAQD
jgi:hypothetical protein